MPHKNTAIFHRSGEGQFMEEEAEKAEEKWDDVQLFSAALPAYITWRVTGLSPFLDYPTCLWRSVSQRQRSLQQLISNIESRKPRSTIMTVYVVGLPLAPVIRMQSLYPTSFCAVLWDIGGLVTCKGQWSSDLLKRKQVGSDVSVIFTYACTLSNTDERRRIGVKSYRWCIHDSS